MAEHVVERLIAAPPAAVWPLVDAVERHREWDPLVIRGESLDPRGEAVHGLGRRDRLYQRVMGVEIESDLTVIHHEDR